MDNPSFDMVIIIAMVIGLFLKTTLNVGIDHIKNNWDDYSCDHRIMPFAKAIFGKEVDMSKCFGSEQRKRMNFLMQSSAKASDALAKQIQDLSQAAETSLASQKDVESGIASISSQASYLASAIRIYATVVMRTISDFLVRIFSTTFVMLYVFTGVQYVARSLSNSPAMKLLKAIKT